MSTTAFRDTLVRGLALGFFVTIPAAAGYLVLAVPLARAMSFGHMDSAAGVTMIAAALAPLSLAVVAQTAFPIVTYASYARKDTRTPLWSMVLQAVMCLGLVSLVPLFPGLAVTFVLGMALSVSVAVAACHLMARTWRRLGPRGSERLGPSGQVRGPRRGYGRARLDHGQDRDGLARQAVRPQDRDSGRRTGGCRGVRCRRG